MISFGQLLRTELVGQLVDRTGKLERHLIVVVVDRRARITPDIERFVQRHEKRNRMRHGLSNHCRTVDPEHTSAAFTGAGSVISELEDNRVFARRQCRRGFPAEAL